MKVTYDIPSHPIGNVGQICIVLVYVIALPKVDHLEEEVENRQHFCISVANVQIDCMS
jgi:hypothetical protein